MTHRKILYWLAFSDGLALLALVFVAVPFKYLLDQRPRNGTAPMSDTDQQRLGQR